MRGLRVSLSFRSWFLGRPIHRRRLRGWKPYIKEDSPVLVLDHVRVIDGTGSAPG
jgi:hypothetical protein